MFHIIPLLINWCLIAIVTTGCVNLYIRFKIERFSPYENVILIGTLFIDVHALHVLLTMGLFPDRSFYDWGSPYGLLYGPLIYLTIKTSLFPTYLKKIGPITLHILPFLLYFIGYLIVIIQGSKPGFFYTMIRQTLYPATIISIFFYTGLNLYLYRKSDLKLVSLQDLFTSVSLSLFLAALLIIAVTVVDHENHSLYAIPRLMLYLLMLFGNSVILKYYLERLILSTTSQKEYSKKKNVIPSVPYQKSGLSNEDLEQHSIIIKSIMEKQNIYLDPSLNLEKLAQLSGISKHHLSQVFNVYFKTSFTDFINQKRIEYALLQISDSANQLSMEQLAFQSGFNSKVSFYRHFKEYSGITPSAYKKQVQKNI